MLHITFYVRQTRLTLDDGYLRDIQKHINKGNFRFPLGGTPNPIQPRSMGKTFIRPSESSAIFQHFKHWLYLFFSLGIVLLQRCIVCMT